MKFQFQLIGKVFGKHQQFVYLLAVAALPLKKT